MAEGTNRLATRRTLLVLAMLALRALVPAGYMLAPVDGQLALVLCAANASLAGHHHAHPGHTHFDPTCPFAQSAGPAPPPAFPVLAPAAVATAVAVPAQLSQRFVHFGPARQHSPRAPPQFS